MSRLPSCGHALNTKTGTDAHNMACAMNGERSYKHPARGPFPVLQALCDEANAIRRHAARRPAPLPEQLSFHP